MDIPSTWVRALCDVHLATVSACSCHSLGSVGPLRFTTHRSICVWPLAAATTAGLGLYHTGVERNWWEGPSTCTGSGSDMSSMTADQLLSTAEPLNMVLCDEVVWEFLSLSMASWNAIFSLMIAVFWVIAAVLAYRSRASV